MIKATRSDAEVHKLASRIPHMSLHLYICTVGSREYIDILSWALHMLEIAK
jgi:hypothetical protein